MGKGKRPRDLRAEYGEPDRDGALLFLASLSDDERADQIDEVVFMMLGPDAQVYGRPPLPGELPPGSRPASPPPPGNVALPMVAVYRERNAPPESSLASCRGCSPTCPASRG